MKMLIRWFARTTGVLLILLVAVFAIGEGHPPLKNLLTWCLLATLAGFGMGWKWEGLGGALSVCGTTLFYLWNYHLSGKFPGGFAFPLFFVPGILFLASWLIEKFERRGPDAGPPPAEGNPNVARVLFFWLALAGIGGATSCASPATQKNPEQSRATAMSAWQLRMDGQIAKGRETLEQALKKDPDQAAVQFELARIRFLTAVDLAKVGWSGKGRPPRIPDFKPARAAILEAVRLEPNNARYAYWAGVITMYHAYTSIAHVWTAPALPSRFGESERHLRRAIELDQGNLEARKMLFAEYRGLPWIMGGSRKKAEVQLKEIEQRSAVLGLRARCEMDRPKPEETVARWKKFVGENTNNADAYEELARACARTSDTQAAIEAYRKVMELDPARGDVLLQIARLHAQNKEYAKQEAVLREFLKQTPPPIAPLRARALHELGGALRKQGREAEAQKAEAEAKRLGYLDWNVELPREELYGPPA